ncbi:MAG: phenylacetate--CoA ligase family protein, partial [Desulfobacteraceae bacterium]|nr:phenylacetate--CoA ligase family protein [Desulfobacteraceae bacterium]
MTKSFMPLVKSRDELLDLQLKGLQWTVNHAYNGSQFYKNKMDDASIGPADIGSPDDIEKLPF